MESLKNFYTNKRVLVTGGAGFIGSHLVEKLVSLGARVTVLDNFSSGNINNLKSVLSSVSLFYADVRTEYSCSKATVGQDVVFHTAGFISVAESVKNPKVCYDINVQGTAHMLEACRKNDVKNFVFSSSSAVYGQKNGLCNEDDPVDPQSPYASSKYDGETLCKEYAQTTNMNIAILRYFNVYGERQSADGSYAAVVARFSQQLKTGQPVTIFGDGKQTRDFIHVSQVAQANALLGMRDDLKGDVFNVGSGKSITILELIEQLEKELNVKSAELTFSPARQGDIVHSHANCEKYLHIAAESGFSVEKNQ